MKKRQKVKKKKVDLEKIRASMDKEIREKYKEKGGNWNEFLTDYLTPPRELLDKDGNFTMQVSKNTPNIENLRKLVPNLKIEYSEGSEDGSKKVYGPTSFIGLPLDPIIINSGNTERRIEVSLTSVEDSGDITLHYLSRKVI